VLKVLIDEMYDGFDEKLNELGYEAQSVKKLVNDDQPLKSDYSVLTYAKDNDMILVTADVENKKGCAENGIKCISPTKQSVFDFILKELKELENK